MNLNVSINEFFLKILIIETMFYCQIGTYTCDFASQYSDWYDAYRFPALSAKYN